MNRRNFISRLTALAAALGFGGKAVAEKTWHLNMLDVPFAAEVHGHPVELEAQFRVEYTFEMQTRHVPSSDGSLINLEFIAPSQAKLVRIRDITDPLNPVVISEA